MTDKSRPGVLLPAPLLALVAWGATSCASPGVLPDRAPVEVPKTKVAVELPLPPAARRSTPQTGEPQDPPPSSVGPIDVPLAPDLLVPGPGDDAVVVKVGGKELRKSHVFDRLATIRPKLAMQVVDLLVLDLLVSEHATTYGVTLDPVEVDGLVVRELELLREGVAAQFGAGTTLEAYVRVNFAMDLDGFRELLRLRTAQRFYHDYVIRFMALREPRVRVRFIVNRDRDLMQEVADKVAEGADFGSLALQHSEDESRRNNGLLPAFGPSFDHPIASAAFALQPGELSPLFTLDSADGPRHYLVYCLEQLPGRPDAVFDDVRDEIKQSLKETARSDFEDATYVRRHSDRLDHMGGVEIQPRSVLNNGGSKR